MLRHQEIKCMLVLLNSVNSCPTTLVLITRNQRPQAVSEDSLSPRPAISYAPTTPASNFDPADFEAPMDEDTERAPTGQRGHIDALDAEDDPGPYDMDFDNEGQHDEMVSS